MDANSVRLVVLGYITAVAMPPVGIVLGLTLSVRSGRGTVQARHGYAIVVIALIAAAVWYALLNSGIADTNSNDLS